ncbi:MAG: DUF255 domain-containing protein [Bacteroidales bacterium]|nr:DUF255 domain-containing protein [Bacteroidales bacterium]
MRIFFFVFFVSLSISLSAQAIKDSIQWISIEEAGEKFEEYQKPVLFYLYTEKCDSCRKQEETTFSNPEVANYINILFYPVKINAESRDSLKFFDGNYYKNTGKYGRIHDLAFKLTGSKDTFPSLVIFNKRAAGRTFYGYTDRDEIFRILIYYAEDIDLHTEFEDWYKYHKKGYPPGQKQIITRLNVKWKNLDEVNELMKTEPRKMIINFYNYNKISCTLMRIQTFNQKQIADYLNENYYLVNVDVFTQDTINIKGTTYINENKSFKYHQLPIAALEGKMVFPAFIILDEDGNVLQKYHQYMIPEEFEAVIKYYGEDAFKTQTFKAFKKIFESNIK